ncbi:hypothetical protein V2J09_009778 [Rumex salicifolius]
MAADSSSLSNPTLVFGLSLWIVAGVGVGAAIVLLLFLLSLWFFSKRTLPRAPRSQNPTPKSLSKEVAVAVAVAVPPAVDGAQVKPNSFSDPAKIDGIERQALLVEPDNSSVENSAAVAGPEVSHLGWGHWYTLRELENATNGFAHGNVIGEGGYGIVYYGVLDDSTEVAVKNLFNNKGQAEKEFKVEVEAIGRVRHKSLVRLIGYCAEGAQRMLVYEYVNNGNLEQWIHGEVGPCSPLTWDIRMNIILGTAKGYVAPEYASTGMLTERSDVYSFGILVMEIISGRQPVDYSKPPGEVNLVDWFKGMVANKNPEGVIDPKIEEKPPSRALKRALLIALRCVDPNALKRPKMGQVVHMLESEEPSYRYDHKPGKNAQNSHISEGDSADKQVTIEVLKPS